MVNKNETIQQIIQLIRANDIAMADLMRPVSSPHKINQVHVTGGRWIEDLTPEEWAARDEQAEQPSDAFELEFDIPLVVGPDGSVWAWIGPGDQILPDQS